MISRQSPVPSPQLSPADSSSTACCKRLGTGDRGLGTSFTPDRAVPRFRAGTGFTYLELIIATMILAILASAIIPVAQVTTKRTKEMELRRNLRMIRTAIDEYKRAVDLGLIGGTDIELGSEGYPKELEVLVEGVEQVGTPGKKLKFLRRIPIDPMTNSTEWGLRAYQDDPDSRFWGGQNVYDVYTKSTGTALDGTKYRDW